MRTIIQDQLDRLSDLMQEPIDGGMIFKKVSTKTEIKSSEIRVVFEDYIVTPYAGFDFHVKFNNSTPPPCKIMYGIIERETEKMYLFNLYDKTSGRKWNGWCPKKSCRVEEA